jgi:hypothetical protein
MVDDAKSAQPGADMPGALTFTVTDFRVAHLQMEDVMIWKSIR